MANSKLEGNKETSETEKEKLRQEYFPEDYKEPFKSPGIAGLIDIVKMYKHRKGPPVPPYAGRDIGSDDDVYYPYREKEDDSYELWRDD